MSTKQDIAKSYEDRNLTIHDQEKASIIRAKKVLEMVKKQELEKIQTHIWITSSDGKTMTLKKL